MDDDQIEKFDKAIELYQPKALEPVKTQTDEDKKHRAEQFTRLRAAAAWQAKG